MQSQEKIHIPNASAWLDYIIYIDEFPPHCKFVIYNTESELFRHVDSDPDTHQYLVADGKIFFNSVDLKHTLSVVNVIGDVVFLADDDDNIDFLHPIIDGAEFEQAKLHNAVNHISFSKNGTVLHVNNGGEDVIYDIRIPYDMSTAQVRPTNSLKTMIGHQHQPTITVQQSKPVDCIHIDYRITNE